MVSTPYDVVYRSAFLVCSEIIRTFDYLPAEDEEYPFIYLGELENDNYPTTDFSGIVDLTIHFYSRREQRPQLNQIMGKVNNEMMNIQGIELYDIQVTDKIVETIIPENANGENLLHGVIEFRYLYTKKEV